MVKWDLLNSSGSGSESTDCKVSSEAENDLTASIVKCEHHKRPNSEYSQKYAIILEQHCIKYICLNAFYPHSNWSSAVDSSEQSMSNTYIADACY